MDRKIFQRSESGGAYVLSRVEKIAPGVWRSTEIIAMFLGETQGLLSSARLSMKTNTRPLTVSPRRWEPLWTSALSRRLSSFRSSVSSKPSARTGAANDALALGDPR